MSHKPNKDWLYTDDIINEISQLIPDWGSGWDKSEIATNILIKLESLDLIKTYEQRKPNAN